MRTLFIALAATVFTGCGVSMKQYRLDMDAARQLGYIEGKAGITVDEMTKWIANVRCEELTWDEASSMDEDEQK